MVLHRVPVGLTIWLLLRPGRGALVAPGTLGLVAGATVIGFLAGDGLLAGVSHRALAGFQALVAGTLLHVVLHRPHDHEEHSGKDGLARRLAWPALVGGALGLGSVLLLSLLH